MFTTNFNSFICDGDSITCEVDGFTVTAHIEQDDDRGPPWERDCGHGPVSEWTSRAKRPGERILNEDHGSKRYYDFAEAVKTARVDGWDAEPIGTGTAGQRAVRAAEHDFRVLEAWCNDEWDYCGVIVNVSKADVQLTEKYMHALWGIERNYPGSNNDYLATVANERLGEALTAARAKLAALCDCHV